MQLLGLLKYMENLRKSGKIIEKKSGNFNPFFLGNP